MQDDLGLALVAVLFIDFIQFGHDDRRDAFRLGQDVEQVDDLVHDFLVLADDLVLLQAGQTLQTQLQDRLGLGVGQAVTLGRQPEFRQQPFRTRGVGSGARQHFLDHRAAPVARHQAALGVRRRRCRLDQGDDLIDVGQRDGQTFEDVTAFARLAQFEHRAPRHHLAAVRQEALQRHLEIQQARLAVDQRHHVHAEGVLQLGLLVQVVEDDLADLAALQFDDDAHARLVGLVADVGDAFDLLLVDQFGDLLDQRLLVNLIGNLVDDQRLAVAPADILEVRPGAHHDTAATGLVAFAHAHHAVDQAGRREVRRRNQLDQVIDGNRRVFQQGEAAAHHFAQVVRRDVGRHTDPLISRFGMRVGKTDGSSSLPS